MSELKPCPFCGGTDIGISTRFGVAECGRCGSTGPWSQHDESFLAAELRHYWNTRPIEDALRADVEAKEVECQRLRELVESGGEVIAALKDENDELREFVATQNQLLKEMADKS